MGRKAKLSKPEIISALGPAFATLGYDGLSLQQIAALTGLNKASLYHHFPKGKDEMALHVLAHFGLRLQKLVLDPLQGNAPPSDRLMHSLAGVRRYYSGEHPACVMNSFLLGSAHGLFQPMIGKTVARWRALLVALFKEDGYGDREAAQNATTILQDIQGSLILVKVEGSRAPFDRALDQLEDLFSN